MVRRLPGHNRLEDTVRCHIVALASEKMRQDVIHKARWVDGVRLDS